MLGNLGIAMTVSNNPKAAAMRQWTADPCDSGHSDDELGSVEYWYLVGIGCRR